LPSFERCKHATVKPSACHYCNTSAEAQLSLLKLEPIKISNQMWYMPSIFSYSFLWQPHNSSPSVVHATHVSIPSPMASSAPVTIGWTQCSEQYLHLMFCSTMGKQCKGKKRWQQMMVKVIASLTLSSWTWGYCCLCTSLPTQ
jgi:hypothetical protein